MADGLEQQIGRLEANVQSLGDSMARVEHACMDLLHQHDLRLREVETGFAKLKGVGTVILLLWGLIVTVLGRLIGK